MNMNPWKVYHFDDFITNAYFRWPKTPEYTSKARQDDRLMLSFDDAIFYNVVYNFIYKSLQFRALV